MAPPPIVILLILPHCPLWLTIQTPSPHRFITSKPANPTAKPSSSLRFQQGASQSVSSQQFSPAPKFNFGFIQKLDSDNASARTQYASPSSRRPRLLGATLEKAQEDIEETLDSDAVGELEDKRSGFALRTQPTSKRRRPNPPDSVIISSDPRSPTPPPTTPPYPSVENEDPEPVSYSDLDHSARPRFVLPMPKLSVTPSIPSKPPLIIPPRSPTPPTATPAFFSPHRRGQKYVPGGLAATARDWIVETSQQAHNRAYARRGEEESWDTRFRVGDYRVEDPNGNSILVQARSEVKKWMLLGSGKGETQVELGCTVGIREPTWEVLIGNDSYTVAIEWKVLNG